MKKILLTIITTVMMLASSFSLAFAEEVYKVTFSYNGTFETVEVQEGDTVEPIKDPTKDGYIFYRWKDNKTQDTYDFSKPVTENVVLAAQWKKEKRTDMQELVAGDLDQSDITGVNPNKEFGLTPEKVKTSFISRLLTPAAIGLLVFGIIIAICFAIVFSKIKKDEVNSMEKAQAKLKEKKNKKGTCHKCGREVAPNITTCPDCGATLFNNED